MFIVFTHRSVFAQCVRMKRWMMCAFLSLSLSGWHAQSNRSAADGQTPGGVEGSSVLLQQTRSCCFQTNTAPGRSRQATLFILQEELRSGGEREEDNKLQEDSICRSVVLNWVGWLTLICIHWFHWCTQKYALRILILTVKTVRSTWMENLYATQITPNNYISTFFYIYIHRQVQS